MLDERKPQPMRSQHLVDRWLGKQVDRLSEAFKKGELTFAEYEAKLYGAQKEAKAMMKEHKTIINARTGKPVTREEVAARFK
jgi:hypothetical protein